MQECSGKSKKKKKNPLTFGIMSSFVFQEEFLMIWSEMLGCGGSSGKDALLEGVWW